MKQITIEAGRGYEVLVGKGLLLSAGQRIAELLPKARSAAVVTDDNIAPLYLKTLLSGLEKAGIQTHTFVFPAGEASKSGETYLALLEFLAEKMLSRSDVVVALGGGVTGDLAGFAAATFLRGLPFVQLPTSLLAMVDSSVGGKTAINLAAGKNLAGAFYQPSLVLCDTDTLTSLPDVEFANGMAEVIKYGMIQSAPLLNQLENEGMKGHLPEILLQCIAIKGELVRQDTFDTGARQRLNLGHTVGHAIEHCSGYRISHGQAVGMGMVVVTRAAVRGGLCPSVCLFRLEGLLERYGLAGETDFSPDALFAAAQRDKKRAGDKITLVVPTGVGQSALLPMPMSELRLWIERGVKL